MGSQVVLWHLLNYSQLKLQLCYKVEICPPLNNGTNLDELIYLTRSFVCFGVALKTGVYCILTLIDAKPEYSPF